MCRFLLLPALCCDLQNVFRLSSYDFRVVLQNLFVVDGHVILHKSVHLNAKPYLCYEGESQQGEVNLISSILFIFKLCWWQKIRVNMDLISEIEGGS